MADEKPWQFKKGNPGPKALKKPTGEPGPEAQLPPGDEDDLTAMRWVMNNATDRTYQHWTLRQQWTDKSTRAKFQEQYHRLVLVEKRDSRVSGATFVADPTLASTPTAAPCSTSFDQGMENLKELLAPENGLIDRGVQPESIGALRAFLEALPSPS